MTRVTEVYMATEGRDIGSASDELAQKLAADPRTSGLKWRWVGEMDLMKTTFAGLGPALGLAVMVVFMIMTIQFKSIRLPLVMLFAIPVSLIGIILALMAAARGLGHPLMGILMVIGIAVSNGILLVDEASRRLNAGASKLDAVVEAARIRFIPIAMTSLATVIGLVPTATGSRAWNGGEPAAGADGRGGLTSSTLLSLFLIPAMFTLIAKRAAPVEAPTGVPAPSPVPST